MFPGGVVILAEIINALGIEQMRFVEGALRDGLLYDMVGRMTRSDARERTVGSMQRRYHVDAEQAERVEATAMLFLEQVKAAWELTDPLAELSLRWGARLHEIGLDVAHNGYHRHGAYLLENADMPGFAREEQQLLARLVGSHRRKLTLERLEDLIPPWDQLAIHLIVLLRMAVLLHRGRSAVALPNIELTPRGRTLELRFPSRWLSEHPLTVGDLQLETEFLQPHGLRLRVFSGGRAELTATRAPSWRSGSGCRRNARAAAPAHRWPKHCPQRCAHRCRRTAVPRRWCCRPDRFRDPW